MTRPLFIFIYSVCFPCFYCWTPLSLNTLFTMTGHVMLCFVSAFGICYLFWTSKVLCRCFFLRCFRQPHYSSRSSFLNVSTFPNHTPSCRRTEHIWFLFYLCSWPRHNHSAYLCASSASLSLRSDSRATS